MVGGNISPWNSLEQWSSTAFLIGGVILIGSAALAGYDVINGTDVRLPLGQAFIGAGWAVALIGLLGLYPRLADRSRWLARAAAAFTVIGILGYGVMSVVSFAAFAGFLGSELETIAPLFLPVVLIGTLLTFPLMSAASFRTDTYSQPVNILLLAPPVIFLVNVFTPTPAEVVFVIVVALIIVYVTLGYRLRTEARSSGYTEPTHRTATK